MSDKDLHVNKLQVTIQRGKHNKENPYVMISKKMLQDKELSPKAKGVLCYLFSLPDTWKTYPRQIADAMGVGKDQIYTVLNELLKTGYAFKTVVKLEKGRFGGVLYEFFEEKLPENERFKEKITVSGKSDAVKSDMESPTLVINNPSEELPYEINTPPYPPQDSAVAEVASAPVGVVDSQKKKRERAPSAFSCKVKEVADKMINILVTCNPVYRPPENLEKFLQAVEVMVEKDQQKPEDILKTFEWACSDNEQRDSFKGWQSVVCTNKRKGKISNPAEIFRGHFSTIYSQMNSRQKRKFAASSNDAKAVEEMDEWMKGGI